jgi:hypothetical protein
LIMHHFPAFTGLSRRSPQRKTRSALRRWRLFLITCLTGIGLQPLSGTPAQAQGDPYCQLTPAAIGETTRLHQAGLQGDKTAERAYQSRIRQHAEQMMRCRSQSWLKTQAIWLRLYPCDALNGVLEEVLDRIVARGYNKVYVEVFYDGQVLLPAAQNQTPWASVIRTPGYENRDLLAEAIAKGRQRGLKVYAWMFTLNFGYSYTQRPQAQQIMALNGRGETSVTQQAIDATGAGSQNEAFIDPYSPEAKREYAALLQAVLQRRPDGVLFDYVRYPRGAGAASVASRVQDLWIYGPAAQTALLQRAQNQKGQELIRRFLTQGSVTSGDLNAVNSLYPQESIPLWQGRTGAQASTPLTALQSELWRLSVAHAMQGVLDFLTAAIQPVQQQRIPAGVVFFPDGNQTVGVQGYDSRLQPWDRFPAAIEWHPMSYATCGRVDCVVQQVQRVLSMAPAGAAVQPALAGTWGQSINGRPALEAQMQAIRAATPQIQEISHFAFSWQEPQYDRDRKFCQLR